MPRIYTVVFEKVSVTAVQDLFQLIGAAGTMCKLTRVAISNVDSTLPAAQDMALRVSFLPATVTNGSGGSSPTPQPKDPGDAAASFTAKANSTSKASTSGTAVKLEENGAFLYGGYDVRQTFGYFGPSESIVVELITAPAASGTWVMSGTVEVEETGG